METAPQAGVKETIKLEGKTLGERHKNLNQQVLRAPDEVLAPSRLVNLHNKPQLELIFIARVANYKKNAQVICELLKSENRTVLHTALCAKWLFRGTTHQDHSNASYFVTNIFPHTSYHGVCRIVANFGAYLRNEAVADELFKLVKDLYGWKLGFKLLPACSVECIHSQITRSSLDIPCGLLYKIYLKHKHAAIEYLSEHFQRLFDIHKKNKIYSFINYDKVMRKVAQDNPAMFLTFVRKYPHACRGKEIVGKKITKHVLITAPEHVVRYARHAQYSLKNKTIMKILKGEALERYLLNTLPDRYDDFPFTLTLNHLKEKHKILMIFKLHPLKYNGASILDRDNYLSINQIKYIPPRQRVTWACSKIDQIVEPKLRRPYLKYLPPKIAVPKLCEDVTDKEQTFESFKEMADCYIINNEEEGLVRTVRQVIQILHQNSENTEYCIAFLFHVKDSYNIHNVSERLWSAISCLIESLSYSNSLISTQKLFLMSYICDQIIYQVCHNLPFEGIVYRLLTSYKFDFWNSYVLNITMSLKKPAHKLNFIRTFTAKIRVMMVDGCNALDVWKKTFFIIKLYNEVKKYVGISFTEWEWLIHVIYSNMKQWSEEQIRSLMEEINKDYKGRKMFCKEIFKHSLNPSILYWLLRNNPDIIAQDIDTLFSYFIHNDIPMNTKQQEATVYNHDSAIFVRCFTRTWGDLELPKTPFNHPIPLKNFSKRIRFFNKIHTYFFDTLRPLLVKVLTSYFETKITSKQQAQQTIILAMLVSPIDSKSLIEANIPKSNRVTGNLKFYKIFTALLKHTSPPITYGMLMKYFGHGCLNFVEPSVLSLGSKKSLKDTWMFIRDLVKESVVMKKMGVNLSYVVCPKKELLPWYTEVWNQNINTQVKIVVFKKTFKLLLNEDKEQNCHDIWKILKYFIGSLAQFDIKLLKYVKWSEKLSRHTIMFTDYCETSWKVIKELESRNVDVKPFKEILVYCICRNVNCISEKFFEPYVANYWNYMEALDSRNLYEVLPFVVCHILHHRDYYEQKKHLVTIGQMYGKNVRHLWDVPVGNVYVFRAYLRDFMVRMCKESIKIHTDVSILSMNVMHRLLVLTIPFGQEKTRYSLHVLTYLIKTYIELSVQQMVPIVREQIEIYSYSTELNTKYGQELVEYFNTVKQKHGKDKVQMFGYTLKILISILTEGKPEHVSQDFVMSIMLGINMLEVPDDDFLGFVMMLPEKLYTGSKYTLLHQRINAKLHNQLLKTAMGK